MPFNGSGTFTTVNTFVPNTTILSAAVNQNFTDIATGLSDCLTRDGQAGMTAALKAIGGALGAPGITFTSDATSGLYLNTTGIPGFVAKSLGILLNSAIFQVSSATVQAGGSGYAVGDTITETGGTAINQAVLTVATLSGSAVATVTVAYGGNYTAVPSNPVSQGSTSGAGTGCTLNLTFATQFTRSVITDEASAPVWGRLGSSSFVSGLMAKATSFDFIRSILTAGSGITITAGSPPTIAATLNPTLVPNYLSGLTMSTAGGSSTMTIAAGAANDSTNSTLMNLASSIAKTTASWAVGTGNGGLDTGAIANTTWYHFYEIERTDTGVVDVVFSLSASAPALPANYTIYRRIGSGKTDASAHWIAFTQTGDQFIWATSLVDVNNANPASGSRSNVTLTVPTGVVVSALFRASLTSSASANGVLVLSSLQETDQAPSLTGMSDLRADATGSTTSAAAGAFARLTNTSAQIANRANLGANLAYSIDTYGWVDIRGKT